MEAADRKLEYDYLSETLNALRAAVSAAQQALEGSDAAMAELAASVRASGRHTANEFDDLIEVHEQNRLVEWHNRSRDISAAELRDLMTMLDSPYFGRIDFADHTEGDCLVVYIGRRAFIEPGALEFRVYDWRAPVASMFYDFDRGAAFYTSPRGVHEGEIIRKRQYRIQRGEMRALFDADALVQDDILGNILSEQAGSRLKVIAQSIQKEQNAAIRDLAPGDMLVLGPAGSGKTSVGLHRVAYLLYHNRGRLSAGDIVAISANRVFNEYIAGILPDLYEADIRREIFSDLLDRYRPGNARVRGYLEQAEYLLCAGQNDRRTRWIETIYSLDFLRHLRRFFDEIPIETQDILFDGEVIASAAAFNEHMRAGGALNYAARVRRANQFIRQSLEDYHNRNKEALRSRAERQAQQDELDLYTDQELSQYIRRQREDCEARHIRALRERNGLSASGLLIQAVRAYAQQRGGGAEAAERLAGRLSRGELEYEDFLILLCAKACAGELKPAETVRHVLVDEAQDYGAPQHFLLKALFPRAAFTLMADVNQAVLPHVGISDEHMFAELYPGGLRRFPLNKSYRSTGPIGALAAHLARRGEKMTYYDRQGARPVLRKVDDIADAVVQILSEDAFSGSTAILTQTAAQARRLYERIGGRADVGLICGSTDARQGDCAVMPVMMSKGLEFDRVIVADCGDAQDTQMLYLMCTRSLHELYLLYTGKPPRALDGTDALFQN